MVTKALGRCQQMIIDQGECDSGNGDDNDSDSDNDDW